MEDQMLKLRAMLFGMALVALIGGWASASIFAEVRMPPFGLAAPSQIDTLTLMATAPADLPVQTADAI
jgi:hypothetical protein